MIGRTDFRGAARSLTRRPGDALIPVITLSITVAAATVIFSVVEGVLLRPLPYPEGDRLYRVFLASSDRGDESNPAARGSRDRLAATRDALRVWSADAGPLDGLGGYVGMLGSWGDEAGAQDDVEGAFVFQGFFETVGVQPLLGRLPTTDEVRAGERLVVLSEALWTSRYGRDPGVLGRTVRFTWTSGTVVGVLPGTFALPSAGARWWSPAPADFADGRTDVRQISAIARLGAQASPEQAADVLSATLARLASTNDLYEGLVVELVPLRDEIVGDVRAGVLQLFMAVSLVILIASVNLATLVVARTSGRKGELAVRAALGARRTALVGTILAEVLLLCAVAGGVGVVLATGLVGPLVTFLSNSFPDFPRLVNVGVNFPVVAFAVGVTGGTAILAGVVPALIWSDRPPWEAIKGSRPSRGGRGTRRSQAGLLLVESGLAVILLVAAGLLLRSVLSAHAVDPGFDDERTAFLQVRFPGVRARFSADSAAGQMELAEAGRRIDERLASLPLVTSVGRARGLPTMGGARRNLVWTPDRGQQEGAGVITLEVSPAYFRTLGIPLIRGRGFEEADDAGAEPVAVVSELLARSFFGDDDPIGRVVVFGSLTRPAGDGLVAEGGDPMRIVGVVADVRQVSLLRDPQPVLYMPLAQSLHWSQSVVVQTAGDPRDVVASLSRAFEDMEGEVTLGQWGVLGTALRRPLAPLRLRTLLLVTLAGLAGLLTLVGIYGVVAHVVAHGIHEIGVRMALGARKAGEAGRVARQTLRPVLLGAVLGLGGAVFTSRLLEQTLFRVEAVDVPTYAAVFTLLVITGGVAAWIPARRAAAVDPAQILKPE